MTLRWHLVSQAFLLGGQVLSAMQVPSKWEPVVAGGIALCQLGLAWAAHHYTPDGQKI